MRARGRIRIGCSGWQYKHWRGDFYPKELPLKGWLDHYARTFDTVEINNSFYMLPRPEAASAWRRGSPDGFCFAWKASRFLTHMKKLKDPVEPLARLMSVARRLGTKLGPILYQLPPHWGLDLERFDTFLRALPQRRLHTIEMRDPSWYAPQALAKLEARHVTLCLHDMPVAPCPPSDAADVGPFVYMRFHGAEGKYRGGYPKTALREAAAFLAEHVRAGVDVYAYFNNDIGGHAPRDAVKLRELVEARV
jgi:uncharacterized protein YecE (DUF72 family)